MRGSAGTRSRGRASTVLLLAVLVLEAAPGCGGAPAIDAGVDGGPLDVSIDSPIDAPRDAPADAPRDAPADAPRDAPLDAPTDASPASARPASRRARMPTTAPRASRATLAAGEIILVERGRGGRSLGFRLTFADGSRAYFKPEQTFSGMHWYAEIAAHHLDDQLGLDRTAAVVGRSIAWTVLEPAAGDDPRVSEIVVGEDGAVRGAAIAWIEERLVPLRAPSGWERWVRIDPPEAITPFSSPRAWYRAVDRDRGDAPDASIPALEGTLTEPDTDDRAAELSDLLVFDYLVHNPDRWSDNSTNVRTRGDHGPLVYLDQGAGFTPRRARLRLMDARLGAAQRFRRSTIDAVRALDLDDYARALDADPLAPILDGRQLEHLAERRAHLIAHVDALVRDHGEEQVYAW